MAFMTPDYLSGWWYVVEGNEGTEFIPSHLVGSLPVPQDGTEVDDDSPDWEDIVAAFRDYTSNRKIDSVSMRKGYGVRLSAAGYMDCTDWSVFDTEDEARGHLRDFEGVDPDTGDPLDEDED